jgi:ComF family protein
LLEHPTRGAVCSACWDSVRETHPVHERVRNAAAGPISRARAIAEYEGALRSIIQALKYDGRRTLARPLAALMRERAGDLLDGVACAVPVPLHPARRRHRGFNQAADLAAHLGLPIVDALERVRATATQADLPAAQRHRNVRGAFKATAAAGRFSGSVVLLVDDVSTTGATLLACACALKDAGIGEVRALTAARVSTAPR